MAIAHKYKAYKITNKYKPMWQIYLFQFLNVFNVSKSKDGTNLLLKLNHRKKILNPYWPNFPQKNKQN